MEWISQFEGIAISSPWLAIVLSFAGGVLASFTPCTYPMMPITVAFIGGKANGSKRKGFLLSVFYVLGMSIVYSALAVFAALTGQLFGSLTASPWVYLIVGNICLFFGLVMLEAVPLAPPGFLNNLKVSGVFRPRCFYQPDTGRGIGPRREYLHHSGSGRSSGPGCHRAPDRPRGGHAFLLFVRSRSTRNRSGYIHRIAYLAAAVRHMDASGPENLRDPDDPGGGIFPDQDWRVFDMKLFKNRQKVRGPSFFSLLFITVLICLAGQRGRGEQDGHGCDCTDFSLQDLNGTNVL